MPEESFIPVNAGRAANAQYSREFKRLKEREQETLKPFCSTCVRWDFNKGGLGEDEHYFNVMKQIGKPKPFWNPKHTEVTEHHVEFACEKGHKTTFCLDPEQFKRFDKPAK